MNNEHLSTTEIVQRLRMSFETHPDLKDLLKLTVDRLVWQDDRYRSLSTLVWGSSTSKPIFTLSSKESLK